ncbi:Lipopolysaccharide-assembly [Bryocella elongata]|uniref:Lipopolysaccharide-assembly n=1 Tax=Bryocella elongata TaxID=863522 RepID=A0A1H6B3M4_9BACT|nr:Lipopolysaccharide-assembly [Bryocella elongata]
MGGSVTQIPFGNDNKRDKSRARALAAILSVGLVSLTGCGYHQVGAATHIPATVRVLDVPIFASKVQAYKTETVFTSAVVRELNTRTRYQIVSGNEKTVADATLRGTILAETIAPLTYDATSGQTSSYLVSVTTKVQLVAHDGTLLYSNDAFAWRQQYQSTQDLSGFVQEDSVAVRRMAHDFAAALVSDMLESFR